ncbi:MAG TPA: tetratricopeptide repeat protein [Vicinamibacterales bacterium]|jgi:tetratricopeptide (TPR) repeat protein|nr:tetratricopeptide repeat protein [Vicinamibacterales bacterium]
MPGTRIEDLRRRVDADPTSIAFAALAEEYRRLGQFQEAVDVCRRGLERHPAYLSAKVTLARALIELNQLDEAQRELDEVLRIAPENLAAIRARADVHHRRGFLPETFDFEAAMREAEREARAQAPSELPVEPAPAPVPEPVVTTPVREQPNDEVRRLETFLESIVAEQRRRGAPSA